MSTKQSPADPAVAPGASLARGVESAERQPIAPLADLATLFLNEDGMIEDCSAACESVFGYSKQEMNGHHVSMLLPDLEGIKLVNAGKINPDLKFLCRCAMPFLAARRDGTKFASEVYLNQLNNEASNVQLIIRNLSFPRNFVFKG